MRNNADVEFVISDEDMRTSAFGVSSPPFCRVVEFVAAFALSVIPAKREMIIAAVIINDVIFRPVTISFLEELTSMLFKFAI